MSFYTGMAATADRLIRKYGAPTTLKRSTSGAYDPNTGTASVTLTSQTVQAVVFNYDQKYIVGTEIRSDDKQVYLSAVGVNPPLPGDIFSWQGQDFTVITAKPLAPSGVQVLYEMQVRT